MNIIIYTVVILAIFYLLLRFISNISSKKISKGLRFIIIVGLVILNVFTEENIGAGSNYTICKRLRDLYNRITLSNVIFDAPVGPEILVSAPQGKFQTQIRITFNIIQRPFKT